VRLTGARVLVETVDQSRTELASGLMLIEDEVPRTVGRVAAIGPRVSAVGVDDVVVFPPRNRFNEPYRRLEIDGAVHVIVDESELLGIWEPEGNA
jgi:hypothetical protein